MIPQSYWYMADLICFAGFSYSDTGLGSLNPDTGAFENSTFDGVQGRYPVIDASAIGMLTSENERGYVLSH